MVPHRQVLQIVSLATLASSTRDDVRDKLCVDLNVRFPCTLDDYLKQDVYPWLTAEVEVLLRTTDFKLIYDYRPLFAAAKQLGLDKWMCVNVDGPSHNIPSLLVKWREHKSLRIFIEASLLCEISAEQIAEDIRLMYGVTAVPQDILLFEQLFHDKTYALNDGWLSYSFCIGDEEAKFKRSLIGQPKDYVRWRLGVPVSLDSERVINRLMSDAYFRLRHLQAQLDDPSLTHTKDQMTRVKLEHDIIFKGLDRRLKLSELANSSGSGESTTDAAEAIKKIVLDFQVHKHVNKKDLTLGDLND